MPSGRSMWPSDCRCWCSSHRAPDERDLAPEAGGRVDDLLHAVDVRREARHDDAALAAGEDLLELRPDDGLGERPAGAVGVRRVAAEQQQPVAAQLGEPGHVGGPAVDRGLVELVVAGDEHGAELGRHGDGRRIGDRVRHVDELDRERPGVERLARLRVDEVDVLQPVLVELAAGHRHRERPAVDRGRVPGELAQDERQRAEVVLVAVGDDDRLDVVDAVAQVREVGQHEVDAHHLGRREPQAGVDHDDAVLVLDDRHVLADLAQPAERQDAERAAQDVTPSSRPTALRGRARITPSSVSVASTSGSRSPPTRWPSMFSAALIGMRVGRDRRAPRTTAAARR